MKTRRCCRGYALSQYLVLVMVPDDDGSVVRSGPSGISHPSTFRVSRYSGDASFAASGWSCGSVDPLFQLVLDGVEVPLTAHSTGMRPQCGFPFQLLNLFWAQSAYAFLWFHAQFVNDHGTQLDADCVTSVVYSL